MISVIVYGRNDAYAPDLHKRAALGLNALGRVLTGADDEILFVDYNTPDELPSFPEAIDDTLTPDARRRLRVLRARPSLHHGFGPTPLPVLEAVARNIALRRSNPANRWVLSTNPDMILIPEGGSLTDIVATLVDGYYGAPRFEIPAMVWERFYRNDPDAVAATLDDLASALHLDEAVAHDLPQVGFDAVGDFQLALRSDMVAIHGFDQSMTAGWHVDSNLGARLCLQRGPVQNIGRRLRAYHCEHSRSLGVRHAPGRGEDDFEHHVVAVGQAGLTAQAETWGAPGALVENILLGSRVDMAKTAAKAIGARQIGPLVSIYGASSFPAAAAPPAHVLPFLLDTLATRAPTTRIGWVGFGSLRGRAEAALNEAGFAAPVNGYKSGPAFLENCDLFVFDFDGLYLCLKPDICPSTRAVIDQFSQLVERETERIEAGVAPRPIIGVNAVHNSFETLMLETLDCVLSPFTTRLRRGLARSRPTVDQSWYAELRTGPAAARASTDTILAGEASGHVFFGPWRRPPPGAYRATCIVSNAVRTDIAAGGADAVVLEAVHGDHLLASVAAGFTDLARGVLTLEFSSPWQVLPPYREALEIRLWTSGAVAFQVEDLIVTATKAAGR